MASPIQGHLTWRNVTAQGPEGAKMAVDLGRRPSLKDLIDLGVPTAALLAAHRHGLLGATLERSATPDEFARELNLDVVATRLTLNVLATCGVLVHHDSRYAASPELSVRGLPRSQEVTSISISLTQPTPW